MAVFTRTLAGLLTLVVVVNALGAWIGWRSEARVQAVPAALRPGEVVLDYRNIDERRFQRARLGVIPRPRVVAFGSSRVMQATGALIGVGPEEFYNLGMSGATVEDYIGLWEILRREGKLPDLTLFSVDPWIFNTDIENVRWLALAREVEAFAPGRGVAWVPVNAAVAGWYRTKELVSYEVLRSSTWRLRRALRSRAVAAAAPGTVIVPEDAVADRQALRADGSLVYDGPFQRRGPREVAEEAVRWAATNGGGFTRFSLNRERLSRLETLWTDLRARGVRIVAYTPPYHPAAWRVIEGDARQREALRQVQAAVASVAARAGARFGDFADPASVPCGGEEFFDALHPRPSCLARLLRRVLTG